MFDNLIENTKDEMIENLKNLIRFPSVSEESSNPSAPFGQNCNDVLNYILDLANKMGFRTKNIDNYCGYIEFGDGDEMLGIIGHLDVVPAAMEDGWTTPPFEPDIRDGKLFGRGSIDDKGPVIASLYAMKAIKDTMKLNKTVRLILGLNEEVSWKCIDYYKDHEKHPNIGFSPDANFPAIYAEKGILSVAVSNPLSINNCEILNITTNNNAINVVPKYCKITLKTNESIILPEANNIKVSINNDIIEIESFGVASHAAHPELGENAVKNLVTYLNNNFSFNSDYLNTLLNNGFFDIHSPKLLEDNSKIEDESGILTSNVANMEYVDDKLVFKINLRVPVTYPMNTVIESYKKLSTTFPSLTVEKLSTQDPLYVEKESYLVKTLVDIFNKKTGLNAEPIAIGGGTYARAFSNCISYGVTMPGDMDMCHQVDEYVEIDKLILSSKIYAEAIYELAK